MCDPHLSALEVRFSRRCAIQIDVYLYLYLVLITLQLFVKLQVSSFIRSQYMQEVQKFKNSAPGPNHAPYRGILSCMNEMGLAKVYPCTEFEVSSFTILNSGKWFKNSTLDPDHAPL